MRSTFYITALLSLIVSQYSSELNPHCFPVRGTDKEPPVDFVFVIDCWSKDESVQHLLFLYKAISCEIPESRSYSLTAMYIYGTNVNFFMDSVSSATFPHFLRRTYGEDSDEINHCSVYRTAFENIKARYKILAEDRKAMPIHVIISVTKRHLKDCDPREVFRTFFHESDRLNVILDIIAIGAPSLNIGDPGVRIVVPKFEDINTDVSSLTTHTNSSDVHKMDLIVEQYSKWITELLAYEVENDTFTSFDTTSGTAGTDEKTEDDMKLRVFRPRELLDKESVTRIPITVPTTIGAQLTHPAGNGDIRIKSNTSARIANVTTEVEEKMKELLSRTLGILNERHDNATDEVLNATLAERQSFDQAVMSNNTVNERNSNNVDPALGLLSSMLQSVDKDVSSNDTPDASMDRIMSYVKYYYAYLSRWKSDIIPLVLLIITVLTLFVILRLIFSLIKPGLDATAQEDRPLLHSEANEGRAKNSNLVEEKWSFNKGYVSILGAEYMF